MGFPNSVSEIDAGLLAEGFDSLPDYERDFLIERAHNRHISDELDARGFGYYIDDDVCCAENCPWCLQPECCKREKPRHATGLRV